MYITYMWLCWVFTAALGISPVVSSWGLPSSFDVWASHCLVFSCCRAQAPGTWVSTTAVCELSSYGSQALDHRLKSSWPVGLFAPWLAGIFLERGSNPCLLHWQVDSLPLSYQGSPIILFLIDYIYIYFLIDYIFLCLTKLPTFYSHVDSSLPKHSFCCLHKILHKSHLRDWCLSPHMWGSDMIFQINNTHEVTSGACNTISWGTCKFWIPGSLMRTVPLS